MTAVVVGPSLTIAAAGEEPPLVRGSDPVATLLNRWDEAGTAAGHRGVEYDNRDGGHSRPNLNRWPRLRQTSYDQGESSGRRRLGAASEVRPGIVIGNASMAAPPERGGSLGRMYYTQADGLRFLEAQYHSSNLYIYPEHRDHDVGLGDLFPTNTPFLLISQGSSGSDRPFIEAWLATVAAFQPELRRALADAGMLMPTIQQIFRRSLKGVESDQDYLSARAHPVVFESEWIDVERMVRTAHEMDSGRVPPVVRLEVVRETEPEPNRDFFEPPRFSDEKLATQPGVIARIWRGTGRERSMTVSAARSVDANDRPLTFRWVLLQGDPSRVDIEPNAVGNRAEITWKWHGQRASAAFPDRTSGRIDIGVFAFNGATWSPPAMITWWSEPRELRGYDGKGRLLEVWYDAPNQDNGLPAPGDPAWLDFVGLTADDGTLARELLRGQCSQAEWSALERTWQQFGRAAREAGAVVDSTEAHHQDMEQRWRTLRQQREAGDPSDEAAVEREIEATNRKRQVAREELERARETRRKLGVEVDSWLDDPDHGADGKTVRQILQAALFGLVHRSDLEPRFGARLTAEIREGRAGPVQASRQRMERFGYLKREGNRWLPPSDLATMPGAVMEHFHLHHLTLLRESVFADVLRPSGRKPIHDPRLTGLRQWRDVYYYDADGTPQGWVRWLGDRRERFDANGRRITDRGVERVGYREERPGAPVQAVPIP